MNDHLKLLYMLSWGFSFIFCFLITVKHDDKYKTESNVLCHLFRVMVKLDSLRPPEVSQL